MRIKAWVVTGSGAMLAATALSIVIASNDPYSAEQSVHWVFWIALALTGWAAAITLLLLVRMNMRQAVWAGFVLVGGVLGALISWRAGYHGGRLLGAIIFATLSVSFFIWHRFRERT